MNKDQFKALLASVVAATFTAGHVAMASSDATPTQPTYVVADHEEGHEGAAEEHKDEHKDEHHDKKAGKDCNKKGCDKKGKKKK